MSALTQLKRSAEHTTKVRGHKLRQWSKIGQHTAVNECMHCAAPVTVTTTPQPHHDHIEGRAVAVRCPEDGQ